MSQENVEIVRRAFAYEVYGKGDRAEAEAWKGAWDELDVEIKDVVEVEEDRVLLTAPHRGRGRAKGVEEDTRRYSIYTLRGGKVLRTDEYADRSAALEAAGLRY
jgi:ketosteroid isomerase-like protein